MEGPKINDSLETISNINLQLYNKYNRHHVLKDMTFITDPTIDPMSYFSWVENIDGMGTVFKL